MTFVSPPTDGTLCLPQIFDYNGLHSGSHPFFVFNSQAREKVLTWAQAANAVRCVACRVLTDTSGSLNPSYVPDAPPVAILGHSGA